MAITRGQRCTATPTALSGVSAGTWLLQANAAETVYFAVATTEPSTEGNLAYMKVGFNQSVVVESGESIWVWQPTQTSLSYFVPRGYGAIAYQRIV